MPNTHRVLLFRQPEGYGACYDRLVDRYNALLDELQRLMGEAAELERRFVENDLTVRSGPRKRKPLTRAGRGFFCHRLTSVQ